MEDIIMGSIKYSKSFINKISGKIDKDLVEYYESRKNRYKAFDKPFESFVERVLVDDLKTTDRMELRRLSSIKKRSITRRKFILQDLL